VTVHSSTNSESRAAGPTPQSSTIAKPQSDNEDEALPAHQDSELPLMVTDYIAQNLMPGERLLAVSHIHPMVLLEPGIMAAVGLSITLVGLVIKDVDLALTIDAGLALKVFGIPVVLIAVGRVFILFLKRITTEFSCTDRRILIKSGLLTTRLREMPLGKVEALLMQQGIFGKLFGYGTLVFKGSGGTRRSCENMKSPFDFYKRVQEQVAAAQKH
jgi:uncharacterized membrane protein YdbT with pleckstrin-like domain